MVRTIPIDSTLLGHTKNAHLTLSDGFGGAIGCTGGLGPLTPGVYTVRLREILYVGIDRPVDIGPGERVEIEVRMRHAAYCLGPVVHTSAR